MKISTTPIIKSVILIFIIFIFSQKNYAQNDKFWPNVKFGGNIGVSFSNDTFNGVIAPSTIYQINTYLSTGVGLNFGYTNSEIFTATNYGISFITLLNPIPQLQLSAEFEEMGVTQSIKHNNTKEKNSYWYPALFLGAGYQTGAISIGLRYDVLYKDDKSIYSSPYIPFIRFYF